MEDQEADMMVRKDKEAREASTAREALRRGDTPEKNLLNLAFEDMTSDSAGACENHHQPISVPANVFKHGCVQAISYLYSL